jgi:hypothetical protein
LIERLKRKLGPLFLRAELAGMRKRLDFRVGMLIACKRHGHLSQTRRGVP